MALAITWSPKALENFHSILVYLEQNWPDAVVRNFVLRSEEVLDLISKNPLIYRKVTVNSKSREALITEHNLLLYRVKKTEVMLIAFFDTRQHPKKKRPT